jgi:effector-binding domain-containing protein
MKIKRVERAPQPIVGLREVVPMGDLSEFFGRAFAAAAAELARQGVEPAGPPVALYRGPFAETVDVVAGFPVKQAMTPAPGLVAASLPGGQIVATIHTGPYDALSMTYSQLSGWFAERGLTPAETVWEEYVVGPDVEPDPARWQTRILFPVR